MICVSHISLSRKFFLKFFSTCPERPVIVGELVFDMSLFLTEVMGRLMPVAWLYIWNSFITSRCASRSTD